MGEADPSRSGVELTSQLGGRAIGNIVVRSRSCGEKSDRKRAQRDAHIPENTMSGTHEDHPEKMSREGTRPMTAPTATTKTMAPPITAASFISIVSAPIRASAIRASCTLAYAQGPGHLFACFALVKIFTKSE